MIECVDSAEPSAGLGHSEKLRRISKQSENLIYELFLLELVFQEEETSAALSQPAGVLLLMSADRSRPGDDDGRLPQSRQFRQRRAAGPRDHQIGRFQQDTDLRCVLEHDDALL